MKMKDNLSTIKVLYKLIYFSFYLFSFIYLYGSWGEGGSILALGIVILKCPAYRKYEKDIYFFFFFEIVNIFFAEKYHWHRESTSQCPYFYYYYSLWVLSNHSFKL